MNNPWSSIDANTSALEWLLERTSIGTPSASAPVTSEHRQGGANPDSGVLQAGSAQHIPPQHAGSPYRMKDDGYWLKHSSSDVRLSNFTAQVTQETILDDGLTRSTRFHVTGRLEGHRDLPEVHVNATDFESMRWVQAAWGVAAIVYPGRENREHLRAAIQVHSTGVERRHAYTHTGWRKIDGVWRYLTAGGAVGDGSIDVQLPGCLERFRLPTHPENVPDAVRTSLDLFELAPARIMAPILGAVYRAPLVAALPCPLSVGIDGLTGSYKSCVAALAQSHWGDFSWDSLPESWESTDNALEKRASEAKDCLLTIDDYAPTAHTRKAMEARAARVLRSQGNQSGKSRLTSSGAEGPRYSPRGIILSTAEQHPSGRSVLARTLIVKMHRSEVDVGKLTAAQKQAHVLRHAMAAYVEWLGPRMGELQETLPGRHEAIRDRAAGVASHARLVSAVPDLYLGWDFFVEFAEHLEVLTHEQGEEIRHRAWEGLVEAVRETGHLVEAERPILSFLEVLEEVLAKDGRLVPKDGGPTPREVAASQERKGVLGWYDDDRYYLRWDQAYAAVREVVTARGESLDLPLKAMRDELVRERVAEPESAARPMKNVRFGEEQKRLLVLLRAAIQRVLPGA